MRRVRSGHFCVADKSQLLFPVVAAAVAALGLPFMEVNAIAAAVAVAAVARQLSVWATRTRWCLSSSSKCCQSVTNACELVHLVVVTYEERRRERERVFSVAL